ncbi:AB hydrolase-1 domain-containing protein, partial [Haematococcus lacustris]
MVRTWFGGVPLSEIKDGNVAELLAYGFWYMTREQYEAAGLGPSTDLVRQLEQAWPGSALVAIAVMYCLACHSLHTMG